MIRRRTQVSKAIWTFPRRIGAAFSPVEAATGVHTEAIGQADVGGHTTGRPVCSTAHRNSVGDLVAGLECHIVYRSAIGHVACR